MRAFTSSGLRQMRAHLSRFLALVLICAVGVTMAVGLKAACDDLRATADSYFDAQHLFDLEVRSTLGLTSQDVEAISKLKGVELAQGSWNEVATSTIDGAQERVNLFALIGTSTQSATSLNVPLVLEGALPTSANEVAITQRFAQEAKLSVGDTCAFNPQDTPGAPAPPKDALNVFAARSYRVVGIVLNPADVSAPGGAMGWRSSSEPSYAAYLAPASVRNKDIYTSCYLQVSDAAAALCYSGSYQNLISNARTRVQDLAPSREEQRTSELQSTAQSALDQAKQAAAFGMATQQEVARAQAALDSIEPATWYVTERSSLSSYASIDSDASSIESLGAILPVVFLAVAILVSLTSITRMVEEERSLAGLWKALGYGRARIVWRYLSFALLASICGCALGWLLGYLGLPALIFSIFSTMYTLPELQFFIQPATAVASFVIFATSICGAALLTCMRELKEAPAQLMRPKAPKAGARILLERIPFIWRHLSFLAKVCARNLMRYKQRFFMTVVGIAGCCALLVMGFGIADTVRSLSERQYGTQSTNATDPANAPIINYDLLIAATGTDQLQAASDALSKKATVSSQLKVHIEPVCVGEHESATLIVAKDLSQLADFLTLRTPALAPANATNSNSVLLSINAAQITHATPGSKTPLMLSTGGTKSAEPTQIIVSYLGNYVVMGQQAAEDTFGQALEPNALLVHLADKNQAIRVADELTQEPSIANVVATEQLRQDFSHSFKLINSVVYVVIALAAALSLTVVYTLSVTNVAERERELATIKVLGFRPREVRRYINRETLVFTALGVMCGLPLGWALTRSLTHLLQLPGMYFDAVVAPTTYVLAAALTFVFTIVVLLFTNHLVAKIDMVGALKSTE